jgi:CrcB protein
MGFVTRHKKALFELSGSRFHKILFIALSTGLCGSITSFSTWQFQCFKNIFLQFDSDYTDVRGAYNGARFNEWLMSLWIGVGMSLLALRVGQNIADLTPICNHKVGLADDAAAIEKLLVKYGIYEGRRNYEIALVIVFVVSTILLCILPTTVFNTWDFIAATVIFGVAGTYLRYVLSSLNPLRPNFPVGTFAANMVTTTLVIIGPFNTWVIT